MKGHKTEKTVRTYLLHKTNPKKAGELFSSGSMSPAKSQHISKFIQQNQNS